MDPNNRQLTNQEPVVPLGDFPQMQKTAIGSKQSRLSRWLTRNNITKRFLIINFALILVCIGLIVLGHFFINPDDTIGNETSLSVDQNKSENTGTIDNAVNDYCRLLGEALGSRIMDSGYIIAQRYPEYIQEEPSILPLTQIGNAATATIDCEYRGEGIGISNDLLLVYSDDKWQWVDNIQHNAGEVFSCEILDQYQVALQLADTCLPENQAVPIDRADFDLTE